AWQLVASLQHRVDTGYFLADRAHSWRRDQQYGRAQRFHHRNVTHELDEISRTLLCDKKDRTAIELLSGPHRHRIAAAPVEHRLAEPPELVLAPSFFHSAHQQ